MNALIYLRVSTKEQASKGESAEGYSIPYDLGSNIIERTYPDGTAVSSSYDDDSRLSSVTSGAKTTSYAYDVAGNLITTALPASNGHVETRTYDRAGRLSEVSNAKGAALLSRFTYVRDAVGNPLSITGLDGVTTYSYDEQDRLTEVCFPLGCAGGVLDRDYIRYTYDDVGNRVTEAKPGATTTYTYDAADRITSSVTGQSTTAYGHDANGNLIAAGSMSYAYDQGNRMISATVGGTAYSYGHDGTGARVTSSSGGVSTQYQWDENNPLPLLVRESGGGNSLIRSYIYGHGLISSHAPNVENYYHYDGIGSVTNVTDASGVPQWSYGYEPFGTSRAATKIHPTAADNPIRFTGEYLDPSGLYHLRARQYEPGLGRFTSTDPRTPPIASPMVSPYVYVNNRPTVLVDPSGFCGWTEPWRCVDDAAKGAWSHANDGLGAVAGGVADITGGTPKKCGNATCVEGSWFVPPNASAWTIGHTIIGKGEVTGCLLEHELTHVEQYESSGPYFLPIYAVSWAVSGYEDNVYEQHAQAVQEGCIAEQQLLPHLEVTRSRCFVVIVATATLTLSSCVRTADAYFANPCSVDLEITTYRAPEPLESEEIKSATLQAESVTKVEDAFDSEVGWSVSIEGTDQFLEIDKDTWVHNTVVIPAEVCEEV